MTATFRDARLKIKRANKHIAEMQEALLSLKNTYTSTVQEDSETFTELLIHEAPELEDVLLDLALIVGDTIHNLHSALDFAWYDTIRKYLPDKASDSTKFPVRPTRQNLEGCLHGIEVDTRCKRLFDFIVSDIQPYKGGHNGVICTLHDLDISDKHLLLLEVTANASLRELAFRDERGKVHEKIRIPIDGMGKYGLRVAPGIQVQNHGKLSLDVILKDAGVFKVIPIPALLQEFSQ